MKITRVPPAEDVLMPIGKYKGMPVDAALQDPQYCEWLSAQPWFKEKFVSVYNIIINRGEPDSSPAHNRLQGLFLDENYRVRFAAATIFQHEQFVTNEFKKLSDNLEESIRCLWSEARSFRETSDYWRPRKKERLESLHRDVSAEFNSLLALTRSQDVLIQAPHVEFENGGVDVCFEASAEIVRHSTRKERVAIEIKPSVGEDFPAVLRQMRRTYFPHSVGRYVYRNPGTPFLFLESYTGKELTEEQFRKFFESQGVGVVFKHEVDAAVLSKPTIDLKLRCSVPSIEQLTCFDPCKLFRIELEKRHAHLAAALEDCTIQISYGEIRILHSNAILERRLAEPSIKNILSEAGRAVCGEKILRVLILNREEAALV